MIFPVYILSHILRKGGKRKDEIVNKGVSGWQRLRGLKPAATKRIEGMG